MKSVRVRNDLKDPERKSIEEIKANLEPTVDTLTKLIGDTPPAPSATSAARIYEARNFRPRNELSGVERQALEGVRAAVTESLAEVRWLLGEGPEPARPVKSRAQINSRAIYARLNERAGR